MKRLPLAKFAANNGTSENTKCAPFDTVQGVDRRMPFAGESTQDRNQPPDSADQVQATMQQLHEHL